MDRLAALTAISALVPILLAKPADARQMPPQTCYDVQCERLKGAKKYVGAKDSVGIHTDDIRYESRVTVTRTELEALDVRIPKPPYGVTGSGHCLLRFSVEADGRVTDLNVARCPDAYASHIRDSSVSWRYIPVADADGTPRRVHGVSMSLPWASEQISVTTHEPSLRNHDPDSAGS